MSESKSSGEAVADEVAEAEFARFCEAMDFDIDPAGMDADDREGFASLKKRIIRAMKNGTLVVDTEGRPVFTPQEGGDAITFHEPTGADLMAMDQRKKNADMAKLFAVMAAISKQSSARFSKMKKRDLDVCLAITNLFLGG